MRLRPNNRPVQRRHASAAGRICERISTLMKVAYLTLFVLALAGGAAGVRAEEPPLLIDAGPRHCQPLQEGPNLAANLELCIRQAELGHAEAQYQLGNYWYDGLRSEERRVGKECSSR